jgi:Flp pilus assembly pilin Flp
MILTAWIGLTSIRVPATRDEGQDVVEYALLCGLITLATLVLLLLVGPQLKGTFQTVVNGLGSA